MPTGAVAEGVDFVGMHRFAHQPMLPITHPGSRHPVHPPADAATLRLHCVDNADEGEGAGDEPRVDRAVAAPGGRCRTRTAAGRLLARRHRGRSHPGARQPRRPVRSRRSHRRVTRHRMLARRGRSGHRGDRPRGGPAPWWTATRPGRQDLLRNRAVPGDGRTDDGGGPARSRPRPPGAARRVPCGGPSTGLRPGAGRPGGVTTPPPPHPPSGPRRDRAARRKRHRPRRSTTAHLDAGGTGKPDPAGRQRAGHRGAHPTDGRCSRLPPAPAAGTVVPQPTQPRHRRTPSSHGRGHRAVAVDRSDRGICDRDDERGRIRRWHGRQHDLVLHPAAAGLRGDRVRLVGSPD